MERPLQSANLISATPQALIPEQGLRIWSGRPTQIRHDPDKFSDIRSAILLSAARMNGALPTYC
jgi:hypothetical protein